jgi:hypothetical protein
LNLCLFLQGDWTQGQLRAVLCTVTRLPACWSTGRQNTFPQSLGYSTLPAVCIGTRDSEYTYGSKSNRLSRHAYRPCSRSYDICVRNSNITVRWNRYDPASFRLFYLWGALVCQPVRLGTESDPLSHPWLQNPFGLNSA